MSFANSTKHIAQSFLTGYPGLVTVTRRRTTIQPQSFLLDVVVC